MAINSIPGIMPVMEIEAEEESAVPSAVEVKHFWTQIVIQADRVDALLVSISGKLKKMQRWKHRGFVDEEELELADEWLRVKQEILGFLFKYKFDKGVFMDDAPEFIDGSGI